MRPFSTGVLAALLAGSFFQAFSLPAAAAPTAQEIMEKVDHAVRKSFSTHLSNVRITTCKYTLANGAVKCAEKPRVVVADNAKKARVVAGSYNYSTLVTVSEPISDKGTSLLVYEYSERGKDNDNWLYLPALAKVNRVIANDDEGGSLFGSEFSVDTAENPEARKTEEYTYRILEERSYEDRPVWVIELTPTQEKAAKSSYEKVVAWIDQENYLPLKEDLYRNGRLHKQRTQSGIREIDGVFIAARTVMNNRSTLRISQMDRLAVRHNVDIPDDFLTQRALTDFSFRERTIARFRAELAH